VVPWLTKPRKEASRRTYSQMHPADYFEVFADMIDQGKAIDDVGARSSVTPASSTLTHAQAHQPRADVVGSYWAGAYTKRAGERGRFPRRHA